jgi:acyl-coenzyme A synthetase/AMP-(fatty) acid ligase
VGRDAARRQPAALKKRFLAAGVAGDLTSLRVITYGTEPMPESLLARLKTAFPRVRFIQTFGTSETGITRTESPGSRLIQTWSGDSL